MVGRGGFEPPKALPTDLQSAPFDRFGISPAYFSRKKWSRKTDLNRRPAVYKTAALPAELFRQIFQERNYIKNQLIFQ